jgi:hypothetical protein
MIEIKLKCESPEEAAMYLEAPRITRGRWTLTLTGSVIRLNTETYTEEEHAFAGGRSAREFYDRLGEML